MSIDFCHPKFARLLEQGYTIEEAVALIDAENGLRSLSPLPTSNFANLDEAGAKRDQEDWWND